MRVNVSYLALTHNVSQFKRNYYLTSDISRVNNAHFINSDRSSKVPVRSAYFIFTFVYVDRWFFDRKIWSATFYFMWIIINFFFLVIETRLLLLIITVLNHRVYNTSEFAVVKQMTQLVVFKYVFSYLFAIKALRCVTNIFSARKNTECIISSSSRWTGRKIQCYQLRFARYNSNIIQYLCEIIYSVLGEIFI